MRRYFPLIIVLFLFGVAIADGVQDQRNDSLSRPSLANVKVAAFYETITDGATIHRSPQEMIGVLRDLNTQLVFRGFMQGAPVPENLEDIPEKFRERIQEKGKDLKRALEPYRRAGYSYQALGEAIGHLKQSSPGMLFVGGIAPQWLQAVDWDPITKHIFSREETWAMALDPQKWGVQNKGIALTKEEIQGKIAPGREGWLRRLAPFDYRTAIGYYPDITNPHFQELLLNRGRKQVECGADAIWVDLLFRQTAMTIQRLHDPNHPAVRQSYEAGCKVLQGLRQCRTRDGKPVLVGTWYPPLTELKFPMPEVDFLTATPLRDEVLARHLNLPRWERTLSSIRKKFGSIPILVFIDNNGDVGVLNSFSQDLTPEEQRAFIRELDQFCHRHGLIFAYPVHGGGMGGHAKRLAYGSSDKYDSLAPEFETYNTIRELARKARSGSSY